MQCGAMHLTNIYTFIHINDLRLHEMQCRVLLTQLLFNVAIETRKQYLTTISYNNSTVQLTHCINKHKTDTQWVLFYWIERNSAQILLKCIAKIFCNLAAGDAAAKAIKQN